MLSNLCKNALFRANIIVVRNIRGLSAEAKDVLQAVDERHEDHQKLLKVAIIGVPNAGKSTLINSLMNRKVCAASPKVHTTRAKSRAVMNEGDSQVVFLDTPGIVHLNERKKYKLEKSFYLDCKNCLKEADVIGVIQDVSNIFTRERLDLKIIRLLDARKEKQSILILNKIDALKSKRKLLDVTRIITENCIDGKPYNIADKEVRVKEPDDTKGWPFFQEVFMVSALTGNGVSDLKDYLITSAKPGKWMFPPNIWTDQAAEKIIEQSVKAILLQYLPQEIPYQLRTCLEFFDINEEGVIACVVLVKCPSERIARLVAGDADGRLRQMTKEVQQNLQSAFQNFVRLKVVLETDNKNE